MEKNIRTASMHIRVNPEVKEKAMLVLNEIGVSASDLFNMLLNQVAIQQRIPFELVSSKFVCAHGYLHDYEDSQAEEVEEYHSFDSWAKAKEWLDA